jgi:MFS family permease
MGIGVSGTAAPSYTTISCHLEVLAQTQLGAPLWLTIIVVLWGFCATSMAWMTNSTQFLVLRCVLGIFEAGTFPGIWCAPSHAHPRQHCRVFLTCIPCALHH